MGFVEFDLPDLSDAFLNVRAMNPSVQKFQKCTIDLRMKQTSPNLLQQFLDGPVIQFTFIRLANQHAVARQVVEIGQTQFIRMHEMPHVIGRNDLTFDMRDRRRQLRKPEPFADHSPNHSRFYQKRSRFRLR